MAVPIEYGVPTNRSALNVHFARDRGLFASAGIDLSIRIVYGGPEISAAFDSGDLPMGELGTPPGVTAIGRGLGFRILGGGLQQGPALFFSAPVAIESWEMLKGRVIGALSIGSCSYWYLRDILSQNGLDPDRDVTIRGLGDAYAVQLELFRRGEIFGLLTTEPNASLGEHLGVHRCWGAVRELADVAPLQWIVQVANLDFLRRETALTHEIVRISREASRYLSDHPHEWAAYAADFFGVPRAVAGRAIEREWPMLSFDGSLDMPGLENAVRLQQKLGAVARDVVARDLLAGPMA